MTDALVEAVTEALETAVLLPVRRTVGGNNAGVPDTVAAISMDVFEKLRAALDEVADDF